MKRRREDTKQGEGAWNEGARSHAEAAIRRSNRGVGGSPPEEVENQHKEVQRRRSRVHSAEVGAKC